MTGRYLPDEAREAGAVCVRAAGPLTHEDRAAIADFRALLTRTCTSCGECNDHDTLVCCTAHSLSLCHHCYRRTHFVQVCRCGRPECAEETTDA